ncbi:MAG: hypothetical protein R3D84_07920 [Paracoccaceae bacterium]
MKALAEKANSLAVEDLVASASALVKTVDGYLGTEEAAKLPASLSKALDEVAVFLAEVREGGAIANANGALSAAEEAARSVQAAADSLPDLANRLDGLVRDAQGAVNAYGAKSRLNGEMLAALRDIREAADAFAALARTIQRNPNSLIMGR